MLQATKPSVRDTAITELFLQTGIRLPDLVSLTIRDVSLDTSTTSTVRIRRGSGHAAILSSSRVEMSIDPITQSVGLMMDCGTIDAAGTDRVVTEAE